MLQSCPRCTALLSPGALRCTACVADLFATATIERARDRTEALLAAVKDEPILRSATLLSYTLRSGTLGFLEDRTHPLRRALWDYMQDLLRMAGGALALDQLLVYAEKEWIAPQSPALAGAHRALRESQRESLLESISEGPTQSM